MAVVRSHAMDDRPGRKQEPPHMDRWPVRASPVARLDTRSAGLGPAADERRALGALRPQSLAVEKRLTAVEAKRCSRLSALARSGRSA